MLWKKEFTMHSNASPFTAVAFSGSLPLWLLHKSGK